MEPDHMLIYTRCLLIAFSTFAIFTPGACSSIYHHAGSDLSVGLGPLLSTRIADARNNAVSAADAISNPRRSPDTAEPYSWDFSKSVASVHDVVQRLEIQDDPVNDVLAALDRADADLAAAVDPDKTAPSAHPAAIAAAADSLNLAIAKADAYLKTGPTSTRPVAALR
jgi:hypothetical protein